MAGTFDDQLDEHFAKADKSRQEADARVAEVRAAEQQFQKNFQIAVTVIRPVFEKAKARLVARNCSAEISDTPPSGAGNVDQGYIGLHCSNERSHAGVVRHDPMFRISYHAHQNRVDLYASRGGAHNPDKVSRQVPLSDITTPNVENQVLGFIQGAFPR